MKYETTANRLREAMNDMNMSAAELSRRSDVTKAAVSHYYNGRYRPNNESAYKMAKVLGVNPVWLMGLDVTKKEQVSYTMNLTKEEGTLIEKYRQADENTKMMIDKMLLFFTIQDKEGDKHEN